MTVIFLDYLFWSSSELSQLTVLSILGALGRAFKRGECIGRRKGGGQGDGEANGSPSFCGSKLLVCLKSSSYIIP